MCRVTAQGMAKSAQAGWVKKLPWVKNLDREVEAVTDPLKAEEHVQQTETEEKPAKKKPVKKGEDEDREATA